MGIELKQIFEIIKAAAKLEEYEDTGLTPEQIREIDKLYAEVCKENHKLKGEILTLEGKNYRLKREIETLQNRIAELTIEPTVTIEKPAAASVPDAEQKATPERKKIDRGKIMALEKAGWKPKDIAEEMDLKASQVSNIIWQEHEKARQAASKGGEGQKG